MQFLLRLVSRRFRLVAVPGLVTARLLVGIVALLALLALEDTTFRSRMGVVPTVFLTVLVDFSLAIVSFGFGIFLVRRVPFFLLVDLRLLVNVMSFRCFDLFAEIDQ